MKNIATLLMLAVLLSGCASYQAVDASRPYNVGNGISINPQIAWVRASAPTISGTVWTIDGVGLNDLRFLTDIGKGDPLIDIVNLSSRDRVLYDPSMLPDEVVEFTTSTLSKMGYAQVRADTLAPVGFGTAKGFRFNLSATAEELEIKGFALATQRNEKLDLILYLAPAEYFYDKYAPTIERIFQTVQVVPPK